MIIQTQKYICELKKKNINTQRDREREREREAVKKSGLSCVYIGDDFLD